VDKDPIVKGEAVVTRSKPSNVVRVVQHKSSCQSALILGIGERNGLALPDDSSETPDSFCRNTGYVVCHFRLRFIAGYIDPGFQLACYFSGSR
jgi:hypothetical protein